MTNGTKSCLASTFHRPNHRASLRGRCREQLPEFALGEDLLDISAVLIPGRQRGIGLLAFVHTFELALLCVLASSVGVAAFHPEASKFAAWLSGERRSTAMSVFSVGGNLGVAIGPLLAGVIAAHYGLGGVWLLAIPGLVIAGVQLAGLAALGGATAHARVATALAGRDRSGARRACSWSP